MFLVYFLNQLSSYIFALALLPTSTLFKLEEVVCRLIVSWLKEIYFSPSELISFLAAT